MSEQIVKHFSCADLSPYVSLTFLPNVILALTENPSSKCDKRGANTQMIPLCKQSISYIVQPLQGSGCLGVKPCKVGCYGFIPKINAKVETQKPLVSTLEALEPYSTSCSRTKTHSACISWNSFQLRGVTESYLLSIRRRGQTLGRGQTRSHRDEAMVSGGGTDDPVTMVHVFSNVVRRN